MISKKNTIYKTHKKIKETISAHKKIFLWKLKGRPVPAPHAVKQKINKYYAAKFSPRVFIETGTYMGEMIDAVLDIFPKIFSIELEPQLAQRAKNRYSEYSHVKIIHGDSGKKLKEVLAEIKEPCLFWLDAHYSGGVTAQAALETPITKEIKIILDHPCPDHVILIDDAREFRGGNNYPLLDEVKKLIASKRRDWVVEVGDDIIRIHKGPTGHIDACV
jgi:hypothetical protein